MADSIARRDFDEWRVLAGSDPEEFEAERRRVLDAVIARAPEKRRQRLRGLQWRVDYIRRRCASPLAACISLTDMMWDSFAGKNCLLEALHGEPRSSARDRADGAAEVIPLHPGRSIDL
jgi:hypothetical protein